MQEEECIIDNLLKEIRQGFQLKKRRLSSVGVMSPEHSRKLSRGVLLHEGKPSVGILKESINERGKFFKIKHFLFYSSV